MVRAQSLKLLAWFALSFVGFLVFLLSAPFPGVMASESQPLGQIVLWCLSILLFGGAGGLLVLLRRFLREHGTLRRDFRHNYVKRFQGRIAAGSEIAGIAERLCRAGYPHLAGETSYQFEVLPFSGYLWQVEGTRPRRRIQVSAPQRIDVAETPAYATVAADFVEQVRIGDDVVYLNQRELTPEERRELRWHRRQALLRPLKLALPVSLWFGVVLVLSIQSGRFPGGFNGIFFVGLGLMAVAADLLLLGGYLNARRYGKDLHVGSVQIVRAPEADGPRVLPPSLSPAFEVLPVSGDFWTIEGHPAPWRTASVQEP